jgi:hypothetical protein
MLVITTMFLAALVLALLYFFVIRRWTSPLPGYVAVAMIGVLCLLGGSLHLIYVGVEILVFGVLLIVAHQRWWKSATKESNL